MELFSGGKSLYDAVTGPGSVRLLVGKSRLLKEEVEFFFGAKSRLGRVKCHHRHVQQRLELEVKGSVVNEKDKRKKDGIRCGMSNTVVCLMKAARSMNKLMFSGVLA